MNEAQALLREIEAASAYLGIAPSTVGERVGQGGHFYRRLKNGCRVWPETAAKVRTRLTELRENQSAA